MSGPHRKILILGCGYLGRAVGRELVARGFDVTGWVRSVESAGPLPDDGITPWIGDLADPADWSELPAASFEAAIHCASSGRGDAAVYRHVYLEGTRQALRHLPRARLLFVSSTSVYGQNDGSVVTEDSPAEPATETGRLLREAEALALALAGPDNLVFRVAGIYGPERGVLLRKFLAGEAVIEGDGTRWINQAHRDDIAAALVHAIEAPLPGGLYNVCDDEPVNYLSYYGWLAERTGQPLPPFGPADPHKKRGVTHKRVSNAKLKAAGWKPAYPTFREGLDAILRNP